MRQVYLVSSCLAGKNCAYDGKSRSNSAVLSFLEGTQYIDLCPELVAGLSSPREKHEITGGTGRDVLEGRAKVLSESGKDMTEDFIRSAKEVLRQAEEAGVTDAILKARSPSCGKGRIYDGSFTSTLRSGNGVTAELFEQSGINILTGEEI